MNLPNKITIGRMFIAPIFLAIYLAGIEHKFLFSAIIFALGAITDAVDGRIARKNHIVTNFGKLLDPIADKMLVTAGLLSEDVCSCVSLLSPLLVVSEVAGAESDADTSSAFSPDSL